MPATIRLFFATSLVIAAWWICQAVVILWFPSLEHITAIAGLPEAYKSLAHAGDQLDASLKIVQAIVLASLAALIALKHKNSARWALLALVCAWYGVMAAVECVMDACHRPAADMLEFFANRFWPNAEAVVWTMIWVYLIVLIFSPNARPWFRPRSNT